MARTTIPPELVAVNAIQGTLIADNSVTAVHIATNAISGTLVADNAITSTHIAQNNVTATQIAQNTITVTQIADSAVETAKINNDAVTQAKIADDAVGPDQLAANSVVSASIANGTIVEADMADNAVTLAKMASLARGKIIVGDSAGDPSALAIGSNGTVLVSDGTDASWGSAGVAGISSSADATAITIDSSEKVGIGTATLNKFFNLADPNQGGETLKLHFEASSSGDSWAIYPYDRTNSHYPKLHLGANENLKILNTGAIDMISNTLYVHQDGKVGIGNTAPDNLLHILKAGSNDVGLSISNGQYDYTWGIDTSDSASFKLSRHTGLGNYDLIKFHPTTYAATFTGNVYVADDIGHSGDADTYLSFENDFLGVYAGGVTCMTTTSTGIRSGNIYLNGASSNSQIEAGNVHFKVAAGIWMSGSTGTDLQLQVPVTGAGIVTAAKLDAPSGDWYTNDGSVSSLSDSRLKKDITTLTDGIDIVKQLRPVTFKYDDTTLEQDGSKSLGTADGITRYGFVAQEVESVASQYVVSKEGKVNGEIVNDLKSLSQTRMIPMLVKAIQELEARIKTLEG